ncbi:MAG: hypothetical protein GC145_14835 [Caulobacter sp.]|nr:hypothetical protein [Caulobacter sp.]
MRILRQVDVVVQNHTQELLSIEDAMNVQGAWNTPGPPKIGGVIAKQGSGKWTSISTEDGVSAEGYIRFGCTKGYIQVHWRLPRAADEFEVVVTSPEEVPHHYRLSGQNYDFRVLIVTLLPPAPLRSRK